MIGSSSQLTFCGSNSSLSQNVYPSGTSLDDSSPALEESQPRRLRLGQHVEETRAADLVCAEGAHVVGHHLAVEPGRAAGAKVVDEKEQRELGAVRRAVEHRLAG